MQIIGHRGASGLAPENTLAAFRLAAELGAQSIETDVQMTRDSRLVLLHDNTLNRTTNGRGRVSSKTFDELRRLDAGSWFPKKFLRKRRSPRAFAGEPIPSIEELFQIARRHNLHLYLEIKAPCSPGTEKALVAAIHSAGWAAHCTIICFDIDILGRVRSIDPKISLGYLVEKRLSHAVTRALHAGARTILPRADRLTLKRIADARRHHLKVVTWTVDHPRQMKRLMSLGVDGIMSDFPDRLNAVVRGD